MVAKTEFMRSPTNATYDIPVLIVGGGPIGLLNACLLAGLGGAVIFSLSFGNPSHVCATHERSNC